MSAVLLREVGCQLAVEDVVIGRSGPHEVLIGAVATGVCHSDQHDLEGSYPTASPAVLGRGSAGVVEALNRWSGD
jgi:Zn-dependent alcohol dehydrogenase